MYLQHSLRRSFSPRVCDRGALLYRAGKVQIIQGNQWHVVGSVRGTMDYQVHLHRTDDKLEALCECPYFDSNGLCKHIWATILEAEKRNFLLGRFGSGLPRFAVEDWDAGAKEGDLGDDDDDEPGVDEAPKAQQFLRNWGGAKQVSKPKPPTWRELLAQIPKPAAQVTLAEPFRPGRELYYVIDADQTVSGLGIYVEVCSREPNRKGEFGKLKQCRVARAHLSQLPEELDRQILQMLGGVPDPYVYNGSTASFPGVFRLRESAARYVIPKMCATGHCRLRMDSTVPFEDQVSLTWHDGPPWRFRMGLEQQGGNWVVRGMLERGGERVDLNQAQFVTNEGLAVVGGRAAPLELGGSFGWISFLQRGGRMEVPLKHGSEFVAALLNQPSPPPVDWPEGLMVEELRLVPRPCLNLEKKQNTWRSENSLVGRLSFDYGGQVIPMEHTGGGVYEHKARRYWHRDREAEEAAAQKLAGLGLKKVNEHPPTASWTVPSKRLPSIIQTLAKENWQIESEGKLFRSAGSFHAELTSGIDWFDLHGEVDFGTEQVKLPELLRALKRGETMVRLSDGSFGLIPDELQEKYGLVIGLGHEHEGSVRFSRAQAGILDVLLAGRPEIQVDALFSRIREELRTFEGIVAAAQPDGFRGQLRDYQLDGLAWMHFLRGFGFGGCLADDMGVGKTPQVLALLETRRALRAAQQNGEPVGTSLAVVPRSLIYNWIREAERFTPHLRVLDHTGTGRDKSLEKFADYDLVLTTYGTLRRDAALLQAIPFDYVILDEAQAIKNASTGSAKAARLLKAKNRLALSGTPVENHLGELWSLLEFLNPGMLGAAKAFQTVTDRMRNPDEESRLQLGKAVRPFILRRTKQQVAKELPEKTEQTLYCELDGTQRKLYNELRDHYRSALLGHVDRGGMARAQIQILEALLRLRQAACHPGLIDSRRSDEPSAKLEALIPQLREVMDEGHKALVFSQFTTFLGILRQDLDKEGIAYEYLDGKTRNREACVDRFQNDPDCKLFLVSLKAGGLGLNLCAAEYVFLLDPWWNPAVESQAIDRAHRIGQVNPVFAYRLIARDTVEEKVIELQNSKRDLADAIIRADTRLVGNLKREDLELLLS